MCGDLGQPSPFASRERWRRQRQRRRSTTTPTTEEEPETTAATTSSSLPSFFSLFFDAAVSVSAIQWLCHDPVDPRRAMRAFFEGLKEVLAPGAGAVLQSYPRLPRRKKVAERDADDDADADDDEAASLSAAARAAGFPVAVWFVDLPHAKGNAKKAFLGLVAGNEEGGGGGEKQGGGARRREEEGVVASASPEAECPLAWPRSGAGGTTCSLWWSRRVAGPLLRPRYRYNNNNDNRRCRRGPSPSPSPSPPSPSPEEEEKPSD